MREPLRLAMELSPGAGSDESPFAGSDIRAKTRIAGPKQCARPGRLAGGTTRRFTRSRRAAPSNPETFFAWIDQQLRERPLAIFVEDAHWADASTLELLRRLTDRPQLGPMLLIISYRSEYAWHWSTVHISSIGTVSAGTCCRTPTHDRAGRNPRAGIGVEQSEAIIGRSEGVPLFIEEFVHARCRSWSIYRPHARNHDPIDRCAAGCAWVGAFPRSTGGRCRPGPSFRLASCAV